MEGAADRLAVPGGDDVSRQIAACAEEGVVVADTDSRITVWNPVMARLTGVPAREVLGRRAVEVVPLRDALGVTGLIELALAGETTESAESTFVAPGSEAPVRVCVTASPVRGADGAVLGALGMVRDVTDQHATERSLRASEARLMRAQAIAHVGDWELDLSTLTMWGSPEAFHVYGVERTTPTVPLSAVQGISFSEDRAYLDKAMADLIAGTAAYDVEFRISRASDGAERIVHSNAELVRAGDGSPLSVVGVVQDVTSLKAAELRAVEAAERLRNMVDGIASAMAALVEIRDPYTAGHQRGVARLAIAIGSRLGLDEAHLELLGLCGALHDIGKVAVPSEILTRPGLLNGASLEIVRAHAAAGADILASIDFGAPVAEIVRRHHERMDGSGYPDGLAGGQVPLEARIIAVADVVEAMASHRPYRPALGIGAALAEIRRGAGELYDVDVATACLGAFEDGFTLEGHEGLFDIAEG